jgi:hypothetical protein
MILDLFILLNIININIRGSVDKDNILNNIGSLTNNAKHVSITQMDDEIYLNLPEIANKNQNAVAKEIIIKS